MSKKIRIASFDLENLDIQKKESEPTLIMRCCMMSPLPLQQIKNIPNQTMRRLWRNLKCETCNS